MTWCAATTASLTDGQCVATGTTCCTAPETPYFCNVTNACDASAEKCCTD